MLAESPIFQVAAVVCFGPAIWLAQRDRTSARPFEGAVTLAVAGPTIWCILALEAGWRSDFTFTVWISAASALLLFGCLMALFRPARRLTILALPYLAFLIFLAILLDTGPRRIETPGSWVAVHIIVAVVTYALITMAAVAGLAVFLKERALKGRSTGRTAALLPAVVDGETLQDRLLLAGEIVLGVGVVTGVVIHVQQGQALFDLDHKTLLTLAAFGLIGLLLSLQHYSGVRGRRAARIVMIAYLLVSLGFLGVKFVTDVLIG